MRFLLRGSVVLLALFVSAPAFAEDDIVDASAARWGAERGEGTGAGLLNVAVTDFGRPSPESPNGIPLTVGYGVDASLAQAYTNLGPCEINGQLGQVGAEASIGMGGSASTERGPGADRSTSVLPNCNLSAEANLVSVSAECETAVGTFEPSVKGVGAQASCDCSGCEAGAYWVWGELTYTTPSVGGCGVKVSGELSVEGGVGAKAGAGRQGDVGAKATLGPVGLGAGINIDEFDPGAMGDCLMDAAEAVGDAAVAVGGAISDGAQAVWNGAGDALSAAGDFIGGTASDIGNGISSVASDVVGGLGDLGGGIVSGIGGLFGGGDDDGGNNSPRNAPTTAVDSRIPGTAGVNESYRGAGTPR